MTKRIGRKLKLRDLQMLEVIAIRGSMARAAEDLALSQPAISKAISDLERELDVALFTRGARGVELTPSGEILLRRGRIMLDEFEQGLQEIENLTDPAAGEVRIGSIEPLSPLIATIIERTARRYPKISYHVVFGDVGRLIAALRDRKLDFVISRAVSADSQADLDAEILFRDRIKAVVAPTHPLARRRKVGLQDLVNEWWALGPPDTFLAQVLAEAFRAQGLPMPRTVVATLSIQLRLDLMQTGRFVTVYSGAMMAHPSRTFPFRPLPIDFGDAAGPMAAITLKGRQAPGALKLLQTEMRSVARLIAAAELPTTGRSSTRRYKPSNLLAS
jgi:DNA-binding transcriptional LysR family regulator